MVACFPSIPIVTVYLDAAGTVERTMDSVFSQTSPPFEYLVVDGESAAGTPTGYGIILTEWR